MSTELTRLHAHHMAARLRVGELSSRELTLAHLDLAERQDERLHAWLTIDRERALAEADAADARLATARADGPDALDALHPLLGIPIALKDLVSVKGGQCTAGSKILDGYLAPYDAHITERLRDAGAVILGKTNMDEFAMGSSTEHSAYGPTANPWALDRVPGGSSGGTAAAVAAFHAPIGIGTDTGGSIRQPAALCGIVGMKPTYGRVSRYGIVAFASSLDQIGPFARDARDAAILLHAVAGRDARDSTSSPEPVSAALLTLAHSDDEAATSLRGKRLGLPKEYFVAGMEPGVEARVREAVAAYEDAGAIVEEVSLPHTDYGLATYYIVAPAEASANLARYDGIRYGPRLGEDGDVLGIYLATRGRGFGAEVKRRIMLGTYALSAGYYDAYYLKAQKVRTLIKGDFDALWAQGLRCAGRADIADRRVPDGRAPGRPGLDVPLGRVHAAGQHGRTPRRQHPGRAVGRAAGRPPADRRAVDRAGAVRPGPRLRGDHRDRRLARARAGRPRGPRRPLDADARRACGRTRGGLTAKGRTALPHRAGRPCRRQALPPHHLDGGDVCACVSYWPA